MVGSINNQVYVNRKLEFLVIFIFDLFERRIKAVLICSFTSLLKNLFYNMTYTGL